MMDRYIIMDISIPIILKIHYSPLYIHTHGGKKKCGFLTLSIYLVITFSI